MVIKDILIINRLGLHAHATAQLVRLANKYPCRINLEKGGQVKDAKSVMEVLMLGATKGTTIKITAEGEKENEALKAISELFASRFNELE